ncbi:MAG: long-chain fatty acid--CoA ligase [Bacteroidales bacterium]|jgi:long-chain acyl-CoA synthetase|nr:long-chain fatty acid--CoA ligase [Bacteroidales bacterium]
MAIKRIFDLLENYKTDYKELEVALAYKNKGNWIHFSAADYVKYATYFAMGLMKLGIKKGDKVASISQNMPHWNVLDMGMSMLGVIHVPIYPTISTEQYDYILRHSDAKIVIVSDLGLFRKVNPVFEKIDSLQAIYTLNDIQDANNWVEIITLGREHEEELASELEKTKASIDEHEVCTIIYTSGTTGDPKGVMLSHKNLLSNALATAKIIPVNYGERVLSFLPLCHVYERMMNYNYQSKGISIYYAEGLGTIVDNLKEIKPHAFNSVPRVLEKFYDKIIAKGKDLPPVSRAIFFWAVRLGEKYNVADKNNLWYRMRLKIARALIFKKWQAVFGGELRIIVSGGSSLQTRLAQLFWAAGAYVIEGYGMSETSPVIAVNHYRGENCRIGTVGPVLEGTEMKISDEGEILARGQHVMKGYYKDPESTAQVIDEDGWMHTGDVGELIDDKFLRITDRKKEIFKTSSGKYIAPQVIENKFKASTAIEQLMVVGENEKFASALISPNFNDLHQWASRNKIHYRDNAELIKIKEVILRIQKEVNEVNKTLGDHEKIKRFRLVCEEWSPATGELSPTLKLKRKVILKKYDHILKEIYGYPIDEGKGNERVKALLDARKISNGLNKLIPITKNKSKENN